MKCLVGEKKMPLTFFFFKQKTAYEIGLGIPAEPLFRSAIIQTFFLISWFSLLLLQLLRHLFYRHLKLHRQRYISIVTRLMLVMVVFFIAFRWIHLSTPLIRLFLLVLILLLMPTLNFLPVWFGIKRDRKSGSAGMPRPSSYAVFCLKKKKRTTKSACGSWQSIQARTRAYSSTTCP